MSNAKVSGGTLDSMTEHIIVMQWQHCEKFKPSSQCATANEKKAFFDDIRVTLSIAENYIMFNEPDT